MTGNGSPTDELDEMFARLARGERNAIGRSFELIHPLVRRFCRRLLGNAEDADDATQQALERVFERVSTYDPSRRALPWVMAIAAWEVKTIRRRSTRNRQRQASESGEELAGNLPDPESLAMQRQLLEVIEELTLALPEGERETMKHLLERELGAELVEGNDATFRKRKERLLTKVRTVLRNLGHVK